LLFTASPSVVWAKQKLKVIETQSTRVGEVVFVKLPGNPTIGYKYRLNRELSKGLDLVKVDFLGWLMTSKTRTIFFRKRDTMNVAVRAKAAGQVELAFDYYRNISDQTHLTTSLVHVNIKPSKTSP